MRFLLAESASYFSTRTRGAELRGRIEALVAGSPAGSPVILDFAGVEVLGISFADELVGRLLDNRRAGAFGERVICLANMDAEDVVEPVHRALTGRGLVGILCQGDGQVHLLGAPDHLGRTFDAARSRGIFRTPDLAADLGINLPACNNRLKALVESGALTRRPDTGTSGGRVFIYEVAQGAC